jgi:hypothetical protein
MEPPEESPSASQRAASPDSDSELTAPPTDDLNDVRSVGEAQLSEREDENWFSPGVVSVGTASFFSDSGHEIASALLPSLVMLHSSAAALGVIEGVSDALMGVMKLVAGPWANDAPRRRRLATGGYIGNRRRNRGHRSVHNGVSGRRASGAGLDGPRSTLAGP